MTANSTEYSELEDSIQRRLAVSLSKTGASLYMPDANIRIDNGEIDLTAGSEQWWKLLDAPCMVIAIEGMIDEQHTSEGGRHPRTFRETVDVGIYLYDKTLRRERAEGTRGFQGEDRSPGIFKMLQDVRHYLTGYDVTSAAGASLGWEGPTWTGVRRVAVGAGCHLWRAGFAYVAVMEQEVDTTPLAIFTLAHGDLNVVGSSRAPLPDVEEDITITSP